MVPRSLDLQREHREQAQIPGKCWSLRNRFKSIELDGTTVVRPNEDLAT